MQEPGGPVGAKKSRTKLLALVGAAVVVIGGGIAAFVALSGDDSNDTTASTTANTAANTTTDGIIQRFETFNNGDGTCTAEFVFNSGWQDTTEVWVLSNNQVVATGTPGATGKILYAEDFTVNGLAVSKNGSAIEQASPNPSNC